jgi:hypothetical protein
MFHNIPQAVKQRMAYLETLDKEERPIIPTLPQGGDTGVVSSSGRPILPPRWVATSRLEGKAGIPTWRTPLNGKPTLPSTWVKIPPCWQGGATEYIGFRYPIDPGCPQPGSKEYKQWFV